MIRNERLKIVSPTLREKDRYIKFQILSEEGVEYSDVEAAIWNTFLDFYGEHGVSRQSLWLIKNLWEGDGQAGVIRCNNMNVSQVLAGLGLISRLGESRIIFRIMKVSGTIKGLG